MTRDEILSKTPGRELDALVAEKVMGFHLLWHNGQQLVSRPGYYQTFRFTPSTDLSAAWQVVEKVQDKCMLDFQLRRLYCIAEMTYEAIFFGDGEMKRASSYKAPDAISKAGLIAVLGEE